MEVKKYRYNDMTERYRRMNRFYIIATVFLAAHLLYICGLRWL